MSNTNTVPRLLCKPSAAVDAVIDVDINKEGAAFALAYTVSLQNRIKLLAAYAAPCCGAYAKTPAEGMEASFAGINALLKLKKNQPEVTVMHGAGAFLCDEHTPQQSEAADDLLTLARAHSQDNPLYIIALGPLTNVASALLTAPEITGNVVIVWQGGNAWHWPHTQESNLLLDVNAAKAVFASGAALVQLPGMGVACGLTVSPCELNEHLKGANPLCNELIAGLSRAKQYASGMVWTASLPGVAAVAWLLDDAFMLEEVRPAPMPGSNGSYTFNAGGPIKYVYHINRDAVITDLFNQLK